MHEIYRAYVTNKNKSEEQDYCDISGERTYCSIRHKGVTGKAKLISSNNPKKFFGRLVSGDEIFHLGSESSEKIHNMLKYLLDNSAYHYYLGENSNCIIWKYNNLTVDKLPIDEDMIIDKYDAYDDAYYDEDDEIVINDILGGYRAANLQKYFVGRKSVKYNSLDDYFCVLILEKSSDGRMSVKYFQRFSLSEIKERVQKWYIDLAWPKWNKKVEKYDLIAPSLEKLIHFAYGDEDSKGLFCKNKKIVRKNLERLIPCVFMGRSMPKDFIMTALNRIVNRSSYPKLWNVVLYRCCSIIKTYKADQGEPVLDVEGNIIMLNSRSFLYGRLMAIYEKIELDAMGHGSEGRVTNAEKLWSSMIFRPLQTAAILDRKIMPYKSILKKKEKIGLVIKYEKALGEIYGLLQDLNESRENRNKRVLNEDFVLGYYAQKEKNYEKKNEAKSKEE